MLTLYHYWSSVCSQKVRFCLAEKGVPWRSRHVDLATFENFAPWYNAINPKSVVPTLDHDGKIQIESNVILEYIEDLHPEPRLRPEDPYERAQMRMWVFNSEEMGHVNVNVCSYNPRHAKRMEQKKQTPEELLALADGCPNPQIGQRMRKRLRAGVSAEEEDEAYERLEYMLDQMEERLSRSPYLAGGMFSLADIAMTPIVNRLDVLPRSEVVSAAKRPKLADWFARMRKRPGYQEAFSFKNPDANDPVKG